MESEQNALDNTTGPRAKRLEKPVITAQTACECDDIAVLAIYSQLVRKPHSRCHNIATLSPNSDVPPEIRVHIHSLYEQAKPEILHRKQTLENLIQATTALFTQIWKSAPVLNLDGIHGARKALRWYQGREIFRETNSSLSVTPTKN
ncbi:hypothetical protein B0H14DRAFT_3444873 [Mycena olivaceomarginata]|nr:hypothetical protein B0H14DRAFT_3444873 [Mycena olivaceomarginata]